MAGHVSAWQFDAPTTNQRRATGTMQMSGWSLNPGQIGEILTEAVQIEMVGSADTGDLGYVQPYVEPPA